MVVAVTGSAVGSEPGTTVPRTQVEVGVAAAAATLVREDMAEGKEEVRPTCAIIEIEHE